MKRGGVEYQLGHLRLCKLPAVVLLRLELLVSFQRDIVGVHHCLISEY
ncbi:MAG: hypothetical protein ACI4MS_00575 [Candidatus Coproplasma sp.]